MENRHFQRVPKIGEQVGAVGQTGTLEITEVLRDPDLVVLRHLELPNFMIQLPWNALKYREEDEIDYLTR